MMVQPEIALRLSGAVARIESSAIRDLLKITERPDVISLAGGLPAPEAFPRDVIASEAAGVLADDPSALQYSTTEGYEPLRAWAASRLFDGAGPEVDAGAVVVTHGSQQALDLVARAVLDPGDVVAMPDPGYVGAIQALRLAGGALMGVPSDDEGMDVSALAARLAGPAGVRPALVYVVPNFHNPSGATLSVERRRSLAELAEHYGFVVVEDDPYGELRWRGAARPPVAAFTDRVVSLRTVSKTVCPGLRVGFVAAPPALRQALVLMKQAVDLHTSTLAQRVVHRVVTRPGFYDAHLARLRPLYRERADALCAALRTTLAGRVDFAEPEGGMFVWARLPGVDTDALLVRAVDAGVGFVPGSAFAVEDGHGDELRLSFATSPPAELGEGVRRLARTLVV
jgi:2-aminoadipate transaminase